MRSGGSITTQVARSDTLLGGDLVFDVYGGIVNVGSQTILAARMRLDFFQGRVATQFVACGGHGTLKCQLVRSSKSAELHRRIARVQENLMGSKISFRADDAADLDRPLGCSRVGKNVQAAATGRICPRCDCFAVYALQSCRLDLTARIDSEFWAQSADHAI